MQLQINLFKDEHSSNLYGQKKEAVSAFNASEKA